MQPGSSSRALRFAPGIRVMHLDRAKRIIPEPQHDLHLQHARLMALPEFTRMGDLSHEDDFAVFQRDGLSDQYVRVEYVSNRFSNPEARPLPDIRDLNLLPGGQTFAALIFDPHTGVAEFSQLFVRAEYQRRGFGALMTGAMERVARGLGATRLELALPQRLPFWVKQGYRQEGSDWIKDLP